MGWLLDLLSPQFLLRNSIYISLLVGLVCPLAGMYLVMRRLVFLGVALPQISACGIALAFALQAWAVIPHWHAQEHGLAFAGSTLLTIPMILWLAFSAQRARSVIEGRLGTAYALASAWSILLLVTNPLGEHGLLDLLKGEVIAISTAELRRTALAFGAVIVVLWLFRKEFMLVSFDREMAVTLQKNVRFWDALLFLVIALAVSMAVISVGPLVTFGFLLIPPLIAHMFARNLRQFALGSAGVGVSSALVGFALAYRLDLPVGPTDVALLGAVYGLAIPGRKLLAWLKRR